MSMEVNNDLEGNVYLFHEPNQQESILRHLLDQSCPCGQASEDAEKILHDTQKRVENNIESLDYLRGISRLERDFVHLADKVVQTSLHLSHDCRNINREALDSARLNEEVGNSWEHITHLGYMLQTHVNHAKRYHLFHLELENLTRQVDELEAHVDDLKVNQTATESAINTFCKEIRQSLEFFVEAFMNWQKLNSQLSIVNPLHRRMPLLHGLHSGVLMASISLSSANGKVGRFLRAGTRVHVRANRPADLMHREWFLVDPSKGMESGGMVIGSVPAAFVWLNSPETSPERAETGDVMVRREVEIRRSQSTSAIPRRLNNLVMVKDLRKHLFEVWEKACSKFDQILRETTILLLKNVRTESKTILSAEELTRLDKALEKVSGFTKLFGHACKEGPEGLTKLLDDINVRLYSRDEGTSVDVNALDALVQAIDVFEELIVCYQRYCSSDTPEISSKYEIERDWYETEKPDSMSKDSTESLQASATPMIRLQPPNCADPFLPKLEHKTSSRTSDSSKSLETTHPKFKHKCLLVDGFDAEEGCPRSTDSSGGYGEHSVSWVSRPSKTGKGSRDMQSPSRSRRRDRFYRFLPIFIRRHTLSKKKDKITSDEDFGFSDNEASRMKARFPSTSPKRLQRPYESLTLDRINYIKKSDLAKLHRTPLHLSTSALFNTGDGDATSTGTSTLRRHQHWRGDEIPQRPPLLYTVACQNGVCVSCKTTEMEQSIIEWVDVRKCGKKMQVGKSFIAQDFNVVGEKHSTDEEVGEVVGKDYTQISHVYANIDPQDAYPLEQSIAGVTLYDIGIQADLPNRLRGLRCRLEFEQPGVELGDRGQLSCEAFKERFDLLSLKTVEREDGKGGRCEADRDFKTLSFRVAFNNKPARSASTI